MELFFIIVAALLFVGLVKFLVQVVVHSYANRTPSPPTDWGKLGLEMLQFSFWPVSILYMMVKRGRAEWGSMGTRRRAIFLAVASVPCTIFGSIAVVLVLVAVGILH